MWRHIYMKHECYSTHTKHIRVNYSYLWSEVMPNRFFLFQFYWFLVLNVNRFFWLDWFLLWVTKNLLLWLVCEVEESCLSTQKVRLYTTLFYTYSCSHWRLCSNYIYIIQVKNNATYLLELTRHLSIITVFVLYTQQWTISTVLFFVISIFHIFDLIYRPTTDHPIGQSLDDQSLDQLIDFGVKNA